MLSTNEKVDLWFVQENAADQGLPEQALGNQEEQSTEVRGDVLPLTVARAVNGNPMRLPQ